MAKYGSSDFAVFLVDGYNFLSSKVQNIRWKIENILKRSDGLGDAWEAWSGTGKRKATLVQEGAFFDTTTGSLHTAMSAAPSTTRIVCFAPAGNVIGRPFIGFQGAITTTYEVIAEDEELTKANVTYAVTGQLDDGLIIQSHTQKTIDWNTKTDGSPVDNAANPAQVVIPITSNSIASPTIVTCPVPHGLTTGDIILISGVATSDPTINGERTVTRVSDTTFSVAVNVTTGGTGGTFVRCNSQNGGVGYLAVSEMTGLNSLVGKIRDSADDITYADLITFTEVTSAPAKERLTVAGTVDRYLSFDGNVGGPAGTVTPFCGFKRN